MWSISKTLQYAKYDTWASHNSSLYRSNTLNVNTMFGLIGVEGNNLLYIKLSTNPLQIGTSISYLPKFF